MIVFLQAGLYAPREPRAGSGRILAALVLVALIVLAFGLGTDYDFTTTGLIPTAVAASAISIGLLRAAYDSVSLELMERAGVRRRLLLVGDGATLVELERPLRANRSGIGVEVVGRLAIDPARVSEPMIGSRPSSSKSGRRQAGARRGPVRRTTRCSTSSSLRIGTA